MVSPDQLGELFSSPYGPGYLMSLELGHAGLALLAAGICVCCGKERRNPMRYVAPAQLGPAAPELRGWRATIAVVSDVSHMPPGPWL